MLAQDTDIGAARAHYDEVRRQDCPPLLELVDPEHRTSAAFNLVNVPAAVWIDDEGRIVRLDHGAYPGERVILGVTVGKDGYLEALEDWLVKGSASRFIRSPSALKDVLAPRRGDVLLAELHFQMATQLAQRGREERAEHHYERAQALHPENWSYHRQPWSSSLFDANFRFFGKVLTDDGPYYAPIDLEQAEATP